MNGSDDTIKELDLEELLEGFSPSQFKLTKEDHLWLDSSIGEEILENEND